MVQEDACLHSLSTRVLRGSKAPPSRIGLSARAFMLAASQRNRVLGTGARMSGSKVFDEKIVESGKLGVASRGVVYEPEINRL